MKKIIFLLAICVGFVANSMGQDVGAIMTTEQNVYANSTFTYDVADEETFTYAWEVYTNPECTTLAPAGEVTFKDGIKNVNIVTITWDGPSPLTENKDYYLKLVKTSKDNCPNYKILHVILNSSNDMNVVFAEVTSADCSVNLTESPVVFTVVLSGNNLIHEAGRLCKVWYTIDNSDGTAAKELTVSETNTITIPAEDLVSTNALVSQDFVIRLFKMQDGSGAMKTLDVVQEHTWTAYPLPTIEDIKF